MKTNVIFETESFEGESIDAGEERILKEQLFNVLASPSAIYSSLFQENFEKIRGALEIAKKEIGGVFTGLSAGDSELGMSLIRSGQIRRTTATAETPDNDWTQTFTAGNDYWLGYSTNNTTALNIDKRACIIPLAVVWTQGAQPVNEEMYWQIGSVTYPVEVIRHGWLADNPHRIPYARIRPKILKPKATVLVQVRSTLAGQNELVLVGVTFGTGAYLRSQTYTAVQT